MNKSVAAIAAIIGIVLSGLCAIWGACLGGHVLGAGDPFPDVKAIALFLIGMTVVPLGVAVLISVVRRVFLTRHTSIGVSIPVAMLLLGPLVSLTIGYSVQARDNQVKDHEQDYYAQQKEAYSHFAAQLIADPGIVLRDRWLESNSDLRHGADVSARQMVIKDSFQPKHMAVAYTGEQLREIFERAQENRLRMLIACHPMCPPDLIESLWPMIFSSRQAWMIEGIINNPATPMHLFEEYQAERLKSNRGVSGWIDRAIEERLKKPNKS